MPNCCQRPAFNQMQHRYQLSIAEANQAHALSRQNADTNMTWHQLTTQRQARDEWLTLLLTAHC
jgi:hypothetical protein